MTSRVFIVIYVKFVRVINTRHKNIIDPELQLNLMFWILPHHHFCIFHQKVSGFQNIPFMKCNTSLSKCNQFLKDSYINLQAKIYATVTVNFVYYTFTKMIRIYYSLLRQLCVASISQLHQSKPFTSMYTWMEEKI